MLKFLKDKFHYLRHKYYLIGKIYHTYIKIKYRKEIKLEKFEINKRSKIIDSNFSDILKIKNTYQNERCFIIGTGPSLTIEDLNLLKKEITFSCNSIIKLFSKTNWRPTFYGIQDCGIYAKLKDDIFKYSLEMNKLFIPENISKKFEIPQNVILFPYSNLYHLADPKYYVNFSNDCYKIVYDGYTIVYSLIQIAIYMGFKEIYLLGCDVNYQKGKQNHVVSNGVVYRNEYLSNKPMIEAHKIAKKNADKLNVKIFNCTRGGLLNIYPRISLEKVLNVTDERK